MKGNENAKNEGKTDSTETANKERGGKRIMKENRIKYDQIKM